MSEAMGLEYYLHFIKPGQMVSKKSDCNLKLCPHT